MNAATLNWACKPLIGCGGSFDGKHHVLFITLPSLPPSSRLNEDSFKDFLMRDKNTQIYLSNTLVKTYENLIKPAEGFAEADLKKLPFCCLLPW